MERERAISIALEHWARYPKSDEVLCPEDAFWIDSQRDLGIYDTGRSGWIVPIRLRHPGVGASRGLFVEAVRGTAQYVRYGE